MTGGKKILILYITERSGHHSAALALKKAFLQKDPAARVHCVNAFRYAFPFAERIIHTLYLAVIKKLPMIWEKMYDNPQLVSRSQTLKTWIHALGVRRMRGLIQHFKPDAIICTQAFPCGIVADYKDATPAHKSLPLIGVLTDFSPHAFWVYDNVDLYVVPSSESRDMLIAKGVPAGKVRILGIPIDPKFCASLDRRELMANHGLKQDVPVVMIMGGGHGLGPIRDVIYELDISDLGFQLIVVCGLNKKLYEWIHRRHFKNRILSFRYTDQIERLMTMADVLVTKPGGITTAEALAKKLPMVILNPIPGQEARNTDFLIKKGAAVKIERPQEILSAVKTLLEARVRQKGILSIFDTLGSLSKPASALDIAELVLNL